jgi:hypothetical protein
MGSSHRAYCECGFQADVSVGGTRRTFKEDSDFPYHCASCGLVNVNIAKLENRGQASCPKCNGADVHQYGKRPVSIPIERPLDPSAIKRWLSNLFGFEPIPEPRSNRVALQCGNWEANIYDNLCPACKQMTLIFDPMPSVSFD